MYNSLYQELKQYRGSFAEIQKKTGKSRMWIYRVLTWQEGEYHDDQVITAATKVLAKRKKQRQTIANKLNQIQ